MFGESRSGELEEFSASHYQGRLWQLWSGVTRESVSAGGKALDDSMMYNRTKLIKD
jgi:hypothetical protein